ncbi:hypothetical protein ES332_A02G000100v1 [Gossypium tomentosum]|uniref:Uncharacterized protein n=1 Tax=Gossypium tomentosum TaxID=34277 RepID=A0A5D2RCQ7_GOSTO|nr:hypothetical protein ES332_A02G000100v1 [Gossypium tomentosum]
MLWERKKFWFCKISPAMASLLQSTTLLFIFSITLILIPNRHAIPFIVLHGYCSNDACSGSRSYQSGSTSCSWCESYKWLVKAYCFNKDELKILECQTNNTV